MCVRCCTTCGLRFKRRVSWRIISTLPAAKRGVFPGMDLVAPEIDYLALARSMGVLAERVDKPAALREALLRALDHPGPALVDVAIDRAVPTMR